MSSETADHGPCLTGRQRLALAAGLTLFGALAGDSLGLWFARDWTPRTLLVYALFAANALYGPRRLRWVAWAFLGLVAALYLVVSLTPLPSRLLSTLVVDDGPVPCDVIVVLSPGTRPDGLSAVGVERTLKGLELLQRGVAPRIVFTGDPPRPENQFHRYAPELMRAVGIDASRVVMFEWPGITPMTTGAEAGAIRRMADKYGWRRVLVVTSAPHTLRARALFRRAGLEAYAVPAWSLRYEADSARPFDRHSMFRQWVYEAAALALYRWRGRL